MSSVEIILPISRSEHLQRLFSRLEHMECDPSQAALLAYVDGDSALFETVKTYVDNSKFTERRCIRRKRPPKDTGPAVGIMERRKRIRDIHNELKHLVGPCGFILGLEDDTIPPTNTIPRLLHDYAVYPHAGFIEGAELGRWGVPYVGAWRVDNVYEPQVIASVVPEPGFSVNSLEATGPQAAEIFSVAHDALQNAAIEFTGVQPVDAGGFYCFMTKRDHYVNHEFKRYDYLLGPDVEFGLSLRQQGYKNYIDWSVSCRHLMLNGKVLTLKNTTVAQVTFKKVKLRGNDAWVENINRGGNRDVSLP